MKETFKEDFSNLRQDAKKAIDFSKEIITPFSTFIESTGDNFTEAENNAFFEDFAVFLTLPDEQFMIVAPFFLQEYKTTLEDSNVRLLIGQSFRMNGYTAEDLMELFEQLMIPFEQDENFTKIKKDFFKEMVGILYNVLVDMESVPKRVISVPIERCHPDAKIPTYAHLGDSGMDLYSIEDVLINPGETVLVRTGIKVALPPGYEFQIRPKSGRALKTKMRVANTPATIDSGYRGEIKVIIENIEPAIRDLDYDLNGPEDIKINSVLHGGAYTINKGEKFAQLVLAEVPKATFYEVTNIDAYASDGRANGGFGSTGLK